MRTLYLSVIAVIFITVFYSCTKHTFTVSGNDPPISNNIPTVKVENYVNRLFIDLIGREPLNDELVYEAEDLRARNLSVEARKSLIEKLQTSSAITAGDISFREIYHQHLYNLAKVRLLEGAADATVVAFIQGNEDLEAVARLEAVLQCKQGLDDETLTFDQILARMIYNEVYDAINMNTSNFVNATFDNLLWRYPTLTEFDNSFRMIEYEEATMLFREEGLNKTDYVAILSNTEEYFEGIIIWAFQTALARRPTTSETKLLLDDYFVHRDFRKIQQHIMSLDEYANF